MDETLLFPSPNWFLVSNFAVSENGWIAYGGPRKSLCVLEPTNHYPNNLDETQSYTAHVAFKGHQEKIVSVSISPEFVKRKNLLSAAADGSVRQWIIEKYNYDRYHKIKSTHSLDIHLKNKEAIIGVGYSTEFIAITVGANGNIGKWDLISNVCKTYDKLLATFKPTSMSCSSHKALNVAVGTKQGVVFVLDLTDVGKVVYKVRSQDDEITNLSWCPQYELQVVKYNGAERLSTLSKLQPREDKRHMLDKNESHLTKELPQDSFEGSSCQEDDMFDIYEDHEANEFGHKKYVPEDIVVKTKEKKHEETNYLQECLSLRELLLKRKAETEETSIESLVEAMDKAQVANSSAAENSTSSEAKASESETSESKEINSQSKLETHEHLLATIGIHGTVTIWNMYGIMLASCALPQGSKDSRAKATSWPTILWATPDSLLVVDRKSQLVECNPLKIDCNNKLEYRVVHAEHKRGLYALATDAPRVHTVKSVDTVSIEPDNRRREDHLNKNSVKGWSVYSTSQDRNIVRYSMTDNKTISIHNTCGGYIYNLQFCPYDAGRLAVGVGDGAIRVWDYTMTTLTKIVPNKVRSHWQKVQGKVLSVAWHPTKENLLAFGTAESRVGLLDVGGSGEKPARVLHTALTGGVYSLCWGSDMKLFAVGGDKLVVYDALRPDASPVAVDVQADGRSLAAAAVAWAQRGLLVGSRDGAVAVLHPELLTTLGVGYFCSKMVYMMEWHPLQVSQGHRESLYHNVIALCSSDKGGKITIVNVNSRNGGKVIELSTWKVLSGHRGSVLQLAWSPHEEEVLLSTSSDSTVRVWNFVDGGCLAVFGGHGTHTLGAAWLPRPERAEHVVSGGADGALRLWCYRDHPLDRWEIARLEESSSSKPSSHTARYDTAPLHTLINQNITENQKNTNANEQVATMFEIIDTKESKKYILPFINKYMNLCEVADIRKAFKKFVEKEPVELIFGHFMNIFGTTSEIDEVLDMESQRMLDAGLLENWITLSLFRGRVSQAIDFAIQRDMLCPYLVNMASSVSLQYMKTVTRSYIAQIDRIVAKTKKDVLPETRKYGGVIYKKVTMLLCIHDVKGAVELLTSAKLYKEAYILCRLRFMNSVAEVILNEWANCSKNNGISCLASICHMVLGNYREASTILAKSNNPEILSVSVDLARHCGSTIFATHIEEKAGKIGLNETEKENERFPSRVDLLLRDIKQKKSTEDELDESSFKVALMNDLKNELVNPLEELPSKTEELMKDGPSATITSGPAKDRTDEPLEKLTSNIKVLMKDVQSITSETDNSEDDEFGHDFVTLQYEEILRNGD